MTFYDNIIAIHHMSHEEVLFPERKKGNILDQVCIVE